MPLLSRTHHSENHRPLNYVGSHGSQLLAVLFGLMAIGILSMPPAAAWESSHGDRANTGFVDVRTAPAKTAPITVPNIGTFATGVAPAIARDGTVYIGNEQGKLMAFRADGHALWQRDISPGFAIQSAPTIGSDGTVYVVGSKHIDGAPAAVELNAFVPGGGWRWHVPIVTPTRDAFDDTLANAPPNIWQSNGTELVMISIAYRNKVSRKYTTHLYAYSPGGGLMGETMVGEAVSLGLTSENAWASFTVPDYGSTAPYRLPDDTVAPFPGPAIFNFQGGGTPIILASDGFQHLVGLTFSQNGFQQIFRVKDESKDRTMGSPPVVLPDGHSVFSTSKGLRFAGPSGIDIPTIAGLQTEASPTLLPDGRLALVMRHDGQTGGNLIIIQNGALQSAIKFEGDSIVPAAASRTHLFVSTENAFLTYDSSSLEKVAEINWVGGGLVAPAIGPTGYVYGMASNILFVFPPSRFTPPPTEDLPQLQVVAQPSAAEQPQPAKQRFDAPLTANGNRVSACTDAAGKHCGKSVAKAFCEAQGFTAASDIDIDSSKVQAETLDGALCTKKKCEILDRVTCSR